MDLHRNPFQQDRPTSSHDQASYSPQDEPLQAPTFTTRPRERERMGSITGEENFGQRKESWWDKINYVARETVRRSSQNTELVIDKLADALNNLNPGIDTPKPTRKERSVSWSERAFALLFNRGNVNEKEMQPKTFEYEPSDCAYDYVQSLLGIPDHAMMAPNDTEEHETKPKTRAHQEYWGSKQEDIEVQGSDETYDNNQASFNTDEDHYKGRIMHHRHDAPAHPRAAMTRTLFNAEYSPVPYESSEDDESTYQRHIRGSMSGSVPPPPPPPKDEIPTSSRNGLDASLPSSLETYADVVRRQAALNAERFAVPHSLRRPSPQPQRRPGSNMTRSTSQDSWFNADPESGRIPVPPLSVTLSSQTAEPVEEKDVPDNPGEKSSVARGPETEHHVDVVDRKKGGLSNERDVPFDSDFENWAARPATTHWRRHSMQWPHSYGLTQAKEPPRQTSGKSTWEMQADAINDCRSSH
ncbi:hypothetical protein EC973_005339 [Apophysomyces ossiformis]|uniref:Uncharacterized protein n=1 Tax=Apophysomyces ossiformis TaxID=679940 RepID=A0A8H7ES87_9FUNG|nr:hypothetical protein EC973_005339 [Apophysomyces ossiformis]